MNGSPLTRPALRWQGGKWLLAPWIIEHFPAHRVYIEPFGGAASVLLRKGRSYSEVYNDLDAEVVTMFRVLRDRDQAERLLELLKLTPYARAEYDAAFVESPCPIETARRIIIRSFMGFGATSHNPAQKTGFRSNTNRRGTTPAHDWGSYAEALPTLVDRLQGVVIENRDAITLMQEKDGLDTLHYCDPPYLPETRGSKSSKSDIPKHAYKHEMTYADHRSMLAAVKKLKGMVILSGYRSPLYDRSLKRWHLVERRAMADGSGERIEALWLNPLAAANQPQPKFL